MTPEPLSYWQEPMWLTDQLRGSRLLSAPVVCARVAGPLDLTALTTALDGIHRRHETLRTRFDQLGGEPVQLVSDEVQLDHAVVPLPAADRLAVEQVCADEIRRGFDLRTDVPLRSRLYRLGADDHVLLVVRHHIVGDGQSNRVFADELAIRYAAAREGTEAALPPLRYQYRDLARRDRDRAAGGWFDRMLADRAERLREAPRFVPWPVDRPRGRMPGEGRSFALDVRPAVAQAAVELARELGVSLFTLLLAVFRLALWQYTGERDVVVAAPVEVRTQPGAHHLIGCFLNTLLLPGDASGALTVRDLVASERAAALDALAHQELPYPLLSRTLGARSPALQVMFTYTVDEHPAVRLPGLNVTMVDLGRVVSLFDLMIKVIRDEHGLRAQVAYDDSLFDAATVAPLADAYLSLLGRAVADPDVQVASLLRLPAAATPAPQVLLWSSDSAGPQPDGPVQQAIAGIWAELLDISAPDIHTRILDCGGHSLVLAKLAFQLRETFVVDVSIADLFDRQTIAEQAEMVEMLVADQLAALSPGRADELLTAIERNSS